MEIPPINNSVEQNERNEEQRSLSDQAIQRLKDINILKMDFQECRRMIVGSVNEQDKTYQNKINKLFNNETIDFALIGVALKFYQQENNVYWENRKNFKNMAESEIKKICGMGPYSHGRAISRIFTHDLALLNIEELKKFKYCECIFGHLYERATSAAAGIMDRIDIGKTTFPEYEDEFRLFYDLYTDIIPRFITLLARNPDWQLNELEKILEEKIKEEDLDNLLSSSDYKQGLKLQDLGRTENITESEKKLLIEDLKQFNRALATVDDYLKNEVKYN